VKKDPLLLARTYLGILRRSLERAHGHVTVLDRLIVAVSVATSPSRHERSAYRLFASALSLALRWCLAGKVARAVVGEEEEEEDSSEREREIGKEADRQIDIEKGRGREREDSSEREREREREREHGEGSERERERETERERQRQREHGAGEKHTEVHEEGRDGGGGSLREEEVESAAAMRKAVAERGREHVLEELVGKSADCDLALAVAASLGVGPVYKHGRASTLAKQHFCPTQLYNLIQI
jgi:hypothetical protein